MASIKSVAFVIASNTLGGHEFQSANLVKLYARDHVVTVYLNSAKLTDPFSSLQSVQYVIMEHQFLRPGNVIKQIFFGLLSRWKMRDLLASYDEVVVCAGAIEASIHTGIGLLGCGKATLYLPFLYDRRVVWGWPGCLYNLAVFPLLNMFTRLITINRIQARMIKGWVFHGDIKVVRNVISPLQPLRESMSTPRLVSIGRLDRQKNIVELIEWLDCEQNPFKELLLIGEGPERASIEKAIVSTTFLKVTLLGWLNKEQQHARLYSSDILILNSLIEGEPLVIHEARMRGMRVIVRDIPGVKGITKRSERYRSRDRLIQCLQESLR